MGSETARRVFYEKDLDLEREAIIKRHRKCKGTGYVEKLISDDTIFAKKVVEPCICRKKFEGVSKLVLSNIPYRELVNQQIYGKLVHDVIEDEKREFKKDFFFPYIKSLKKAAKNPFGFLLLGKNGTGKTFVGLKILFYAIKAGMTAHSIEMSEFLKLARKTFDREPLIEDLLYEISTVDFLMVDEIGNESKSSRYVISEFKSLYKRRILLNKPTILVSNYSFQEFKKVYGKSITNLVESYCKVFDFSMSADVRKTKGRMDMDTFFKKIKRKK